MKSIAIAFIALGLLSGAASAHDAKVFTDLSKTAPHGVFDDLRDTAPRSPFDDLNATAPRAKKGNIFLHISRTAP